MRVVVTANDVKLWLSARDTWEWATRPGMRWPCSDLSNHRLFAAFDSNGLYEVTIDGRNRDCGADEFNACTSDHLRDRLPQDHPAWFVTVGQFRRHTEE